MKTVTAEKKEKFGSYSLHKASSLFAAQQNVRIVKVCYVSDIEGSLSVSVRRC